MGTKPGKDSKGGLERRDFLKLGATGVVAGIAGCAVPGSKEPIQIKTSAAESSGEDADQKTPSIPEIGDLIDPEMVSIETWQEPWTWRPELWPDAALELNVVRNQNPGFSPSPGNPASTIFSYNGTSPGPTVRVRNDGTLLIKIRNTLGLNEQMTPVGPGPDPFEFTAEVRREICALVEEQILGGDPENPRKCFPDVRPEQVYQIIDSELLPGWNLGGHLNGQHAAHTTNLHTHGLHVFPQKNPDGSHSDNVFLRIIPKADEQARLTAKGKNADVISEHEHVGELDYKLQLSFKSGGKVMPHPPGTHWYHPHSHGATHDQVASGMAGFLIVEGDVDKAINVAMCGEKWPDPEVRVGPFDYRERAIFFQRTHKQSFDMDAGPKRDNLRFPPLMAVNGTHKPGLIRMRPGAVERWRVLNGSVDGAGTKRFMVLEGQFVQRDDRIWRVVVEADADTRKRRLEPVTEQDFEDNKLDLQQLSVDGITLVTEKNGKAMHTIKDLSQQNAGTLNPFATVSMNGESEYETQLRGCEAVYKDGDSLRRSYVRPNEVYMTNANRTDLLFKVPLNKSGRVFTIFAKEAHIQTDNLQFSMQKRIKESGLGPNRAKFDVVIAYIHVQGEPVEGGDFDIQSLVEKLPVVPPLLQPVRADELRVPASEAGFTGVPVGSGRSRTMSYSGTGGTDFPTIKVPEGFAENNKKYENMLWATLDDTQFLMANLTRTMAINPEFDLTVNPEPDLPRKFTPFDHKRPRVLVDTAEEWVVYNSSLLLWSHTDLERFPQPGSYRAHYVSYPISRAEGQRRFALDPEFRISVKGVDHPFHMHINPMWVLRIDVPDENGNLHNVLPEPVWMDTIPTPRNGGRIIFRTRFDDFVGHWVNHCHILLHEDMGMMQMVECTDKISEVNYHPRNQSVSHAMSGAEVDKIYPKPSLEIMYKQNLSFIDPNEIGYQVYPGFDLEVPKLDDDPS